MITIDLYLIIIVLRTTFDSTKDGERFLFSAFGISIQSDILTVGVRILNCNFELELQRVMESKTKLIRNLRAITYLVIAGILLITNIVIQGFLPFLVAYGLHTLFQ